MPWVQSEYAEELAVVSAWIAALLPWSATVGARVEGGRLFVLRFPLAEFQFRAPTRVVLPDRTFTAAEVLDAQYPGWQVWGHTYVADPVSAALTYAGATLQSGSLLWALGAVLVATAVALSVAMYRDEAATALRLPYDPVRVMGVLLGGATVALVAATVLYYQGRAVVGVPIPIGPFVVGALSVALLRADRV